MITPIQGSGDNSSRRSQRQILVSRRMKPVQQVFSLGIQIQPLTVLNQTAKGLPETVGEGADQYELRPGVLKDLQRIKWFLWHGNVFQALNELQSLEIHSDAAATESKDKNAQNS